MNKSSLASSGKVWSVKHGLKWLNAQAKAGKRKVPRKSGDSSQALAMPRGSAN